MSGAILSVPLLGATKVLLDECDHPMAKNILYVIKVRCQSAHCTLRNRTKNSVMHGFLIPGRQQHRGAGGVEEV